MENESCDTCKRRFTCILNGNIIKHQCGLYVEESDVVEVIRCKDCKHRGTYDCPVYVGGDGMCSEPDDWFCADGERK